MADVEWIKLTVGMFDGNSFKRIKNAKIGGERFRDKLTAIWFELMDFAGKCNASGQLIESPDMPPSTIEDIAILIDREVEELELCMQYYINNRMITIENNVYTLTNWAKYQNEDGLALIREQTRKRVAKHRKKQKLLGCNVTSNVTVTQSNATDKEEDKDKDKDTEVEVVDNCDNDDVLTYFNKNLLLSENQVAELLDIMGLEVFDEYTSRLSKFIEDTGATVKSHYATLLKWYNEDRAVKV